MSTRRLDFWFATAIGVALILASWRHLIPYSLTETLGFVTGAACVYLVVKENIWNFPVGIANDLFFLILFGRARLYGDAGLQVIYVLLALQGWYLWLHGGQNKSILRITRASPKTLVVLTVITIAATSVLAIILRAVRGAAPILDAFTTILSLTAQYMLNKKYLENWWVWIAADVIYIYLYLSRGLGLTALLYAVFLVLCVTGIRNWSQAVEQSRSDALQIG
jgi:nicotinamide mononucleotide transporter